MIITNKFNLPAPFVSLVQMGVLENDGWKHIEYFTDSFAVDPKNPRVEVVIEDYEGGKPYYDRKGKN